MNSDDAIKTVRINLMEFHEQGYNEVEIVHGKGSGVLREKIRLLLSQTPYVKEFKILSDDGATLAIF